MPTDTPSTAPQRFRAMAEAVERNEGGSFGGAFVVIPPPEAGDPLETLILDSKQDPAQFWNLLMTKCQIMLAELDQKQRANAAFGRPSR